MNNWPERLRKILDLIDSMPPEQLLETFEQTYERFDT